MKIVITKQEIISMIKQKLCSISDEAIINDIEVEIVIKDNVKPEQINPWLVPDENGWFTHDPSWDKCEAPDYIDCTRAIAIVFRNGETSGLDYGDDVYYIARDYTWAVNEDAWTIVKWKYAN